jgi:hypothetical protein
MPDLGGHPVTLRENNSIDNSTSRRPSRTKLALSNLAQRPMATKAAHQQEQIEALTAGLQRVSAQVEMSRPAPQMALNNQ